MSGLGTLIRALAGEREIELDDEEMASFGLSEEGEADTPTDILSVDLGGSAEGRLEIFLAEDLSTSTTTAKKVGDDGLMWEPIIRSGQWATRPGPNGQKLRRPLKVVAGNSTNQLKEIGLQDIVDAFDDDAIEYVTVPLSHDNKTSENTGQIKGLKIVDGTAKDKKTKKDIKVKVLMGGYNFTEPDIKGKVERGTILGRSAGLLYGYTDTERGKTYPVVLEHVALTNKPWITGMKPFGRKLKLSQDITPLDLRLSDEIVDEDAFLLSLQNDEHINLDTSPSVNVGKPQADTADAITWDHEDSPNWLRQQVCQILDEARAAKQKARRNAQPNSYLYESPPYYRCIEAKPGAALISDGYGDDANFWVADISVADGAVSLSDFTTWEATKKVFVPDDRQPPAPANEPLDETGVTDPTSAGETPSRLKLAQEARRRRARPETEPTTTPPGGGQKMEGSVANGTRELVLSEEARREMDELNTKLAESEARNEKLSQTVERLSGSVNKGEVSTYIADLKAEGFDEKHGLGGVLVVIQDLMLADDGEPAVQSENFADDTNKTGELSLSDAIKRIFGAIKRTDDGKIALGEVLVEPADPTESETTELDEDGKPKKVVATTPTGKPGPEKEEKTELSTEQKVDQITATSPEVARVLGRQMSDPAPAEPTTTTPAGGDA